MLAFCVSYGRMNILSETWKGEAMRFWISVLILIALTLGSVFAQEATPEASAELIELENITLLLIGDVILEDTGVVPGQVIKIDTATNNEDCTQPSECGVVIQTAPNLQGATILLNGVILSLDNATVLVQATPGDALRIYALAGDSFVTVQSTQATIPVGSMLAIPLDATGAAGAIDSTPEPFDRALPETLTPVLALLPTEVKFEQPEIISTVEQTEEAEATDEAVEATEVITEAVTEQVTEEATEDVELDRIIGAVETTPEAEAAVTETPSPTPTLAPTTAAESATSVAIVPTLTATPTPTATRPATNITGVTPAAVDEDACGSVLTTVRNPQPGDLGIRQLEFPSCIPLGGVATGEFTWVGRAARFEITVLETCATCGWNFAESYALGRGLTSWTLQLVCLPNSPRVTHRFGIQLFDAQGNSSDVVEFETIC